MIERNGEKLGSIRVDPSSKPPAQPEKKAAAKKVAPAKAVEPPAEKPEVDDKAEAAPAKPAKSAAAEFKSALDSPKE